MKVIIKWNIVTLANTKQQKTLWIIIVVINNSTDR